MFVRGYDRRPALQPADNEELMLIFGQTNSSEWNLGYIIRRLESLAARNHGKSVAVTLKCRPQATASGAMDDVWSNAWSQPEEDIDVSRSIVSKLTKLNDATTWSSFKQEETDVGLPSWSSGDLNWAEPSGQESLWSAVEDYSLDTSSWITNVSDKLSQDMGNERGNVVGTLLMPGSSGSREKDTEDAILEDATPHGPSLGTPESTGTATPGSPKGVDIEIPVSTIGIESSSMEAISPLAVPHLGAMADDFRPSIIGSDFVREGIAQNTSHASEGWISPSLALNAPDGIEDAWNTGWGDISIAEKMPSPQEDEWAIAEQQKHFRDHMVPPDVLAALMSSVRELSDSVWPEYASSKEESDIRSWRYGLDSIDGLEGLTMKFLPDPMPPAQISFFRTNTAKAMMNSIKLTKNLLVVRRGPMFHLFTAKNSAVWERSVKSKADTYIDDTPAGWRIAEPGEMDEAKPQATEKKTGGFLSFWNKRTFTQTPPSSGTVTPKISEQESTDLRKEKSDNSSELEVVSLNTVQDAGKQSSAGNVQSGSISSLSSLISPVLPDASAPLSRSLSSRSDLPMDELSPDSTSIQPAPSIVSRFLSKFSRTKSDSRRSSANTSLALSEGDIEFLSEIVPSHPDDTEDEEQLNALTALVSSSTGPTTLAPLLPPPPSSKSLSHTTDQSKLSQVSKAASFLTQAGDRTASSAFENLLDYDSNAVGTPSPTALPMDISSSSLHLPVPLPSPLRQVSPSRPLSKFPSLQEAQSSAFIASPDALINAPTVATDLNDTHTSCSTRANERTSIFSSRASPPTPPSKFTSPSDANQLFTPPPDIGQGSSQSEKPPPIEKSPDRTYTYQNPQMLIDDDFSDFQSPTTSFTSPLVQTSNMEQLADLLTDGLRSSPAIEAQSSGFKRELSEDLYMFVPTSTASPSSHYPTTRQDCYEPNAELNSLTSIVVSCDAVEPRVRQKPAASPQCRNASGSPNPALVSPSAVPTRVISPMARPLQSIELKPITDITSASLLRSCTPLSSNSLDSSMVKPKFPGNALLNFENSNEGAFDLQPLTLQGRDTQRSQPSSKTSSTSGLSTQDLLFFEGL